MSIGSSPVNSQLFGNVTSPQTLSFTPTAGNSLIIYQLVGPGGSFVTSPVLTNVTWTSLAQYAVNRKTATFIGAVAAGAGTALSWTGAGFNGFVVEWSGLDGGWDSVNSAGANGSGTSTATASVTPTGGSNVLLLAGSNRAGTFSSGPTNSFVDVTGSASSRLAYLVVNGASGAYSTTWTYSTSQSWDAYMLILTAASSATSWGPDLSDQLNRIVVAHP